MNTLPQDNALKGILLALQNDDQSSALYDQLEAAGFVMCTITALNGKVCNFTFRGRTEIVGRGETVAEALADAKAKLDAYVHFEGEREAHRQAEADAHDLTKIAAAERSKKAAEHRDNLHRTIERSIFGTTEREREPEPPAQPDVPPLEDTLPDPPTRPTSEQYGLPF